MYNPNRCNKTTGHCFACSGSDFGSFYEYEMEVYQQPISMLQVTMFTFLGLSIFNSIQMFSLSLSLMLIAGCNLFFRKKMNK